MTQPALFADPTWTSRYSVGDPVRERHGSVAGFVDEVGPDHLWVRYDHPHFGDMVTRYGSDHCLIRNGAQRSRTLSCGAGALSPSGSLRAGIGPESQPGRGEPAGHGPEAVAGKNDEDPAACDSEALNPTRVRNTNGA